MTRILFGICVLFVVCAVSCISTVAPSQEPPRRIITINNEPTYEYPVLEPKDYTVLGVITIQVQRTTLINATLMGEARKLGGHDIINVRYDMADGQIVAATAVVIQYKE